MAIDSIPSPTEPGELQKKVAPPAPPEPVLIYGNTTARVSLDASNVSAAVSVWGADRERQRAVLITALLKLLAKVRNS